MARNFWRHPVPAARNPRLRLEGLECRVVPAIVQTGLPTWMAAGPFRTTEAQVTGLQGTFSDPVSGAVTSVIPNPLDKNVAFIGATGGGVWRTNNLQDADPTYTPLTDQLPSLSVSSMDLNPANPNQLLVGIGDKSAASNESGSVVGDLVGLYATDNALDPNPTFRVIGGQNAEFVNLTISSVVMRSSYMLVAGFDSDITTAREGIFLSTDGGATFRTLDGVNGLPAQTGTGRRTFDLRADPANPSRVYAIGQTGLFRTDDILAASPTWANVTDPRMGLNAASSNARLAIHSSGGTNVIYAAMADASALNGLFWSASFGATWTPMDIPTSLGTLQGVQDVTDGDPIGITSPGHNLATGDKVVVSGVTGDLGANGVWTVTVTGGNTFTLDQSVTTGVYTGGGTFQKVFGVHTGGQANLHFALAADPTDPNLVYVAGDRQDLQFNNGSTPNGVGARNFTANILRGNRSVPSGFNAFAPSPQWEPITDNNALGTAPHADSRSLAFDPLGNLYNGNDGGIYRRAQPSSNSAAWTSVIGNLSVAQFNSVSHDSVNNVAFGGTQDTGSTEQISGTGASGDVTWRDISGGDGGQSAVDNTSSPGTSIRYTMSNNLFSLQSRQFNSKGAQVGPNHRIRLSSPTDPTYLSGIDDIGSSFSTKYVLNSVDPRLFMLGQGNVFEDNNPSGFAGDVVAVVTPPGMAGYTTSLAYGGRQNGLNLPRIAYVGTDAGELFVRGAAGGFQPVTVPGAGEIRSVVLDPDDWRTAYVLRGTVETLLGSRPFNPSRVFVTHDAGATFTELTENLFSKSYDVNGNLTNGLTSNVTVLGLWDPTPGGASGGGGAVLIAAGTGGVFRYVPAIQATPGAGWSQYGTGLPSAFVDTLILTGNRLTVGTMGRGVFTIPDIAPTITVAAQVTVQGTAGDDNFTFGGSGTTAGSVFVSDGQGNSLFVNRKTGASFSFVGGDGADTLTLATSGQPGGNLQFFTGHINANMGNNPGDTIVISDEGRATPTAVTVAASTVGAGAADNLFAPGGVLDYFGLAQGTLRLDLGTQAGGGNLVNVQSTSAGTTQLFGSGGDDAFVLNGLAGAAAETGDLSGLFGTVSVDGRGGANALTVSDFGAASGNANANILGGQILGMAGPTDAAVVSYANVTSLTVLGSNSPTLAESFRVENPAAPLTLADNAGPDFVNVRAATKAVTLNGGPGSVVFRITSTAGDTLDGDLLGILAPVTVNAGAGSSQLVVSNFGNAAGATYVVGVNPSGASTITGATPQPITFGTAGRFAGPDGDGVWLRGSNTGNDTFNLGVTLGSGSQTAIDGGGGNDVFNVTADSLGAGGTVTLRAGGGTNIVAVDSGVFGVTSDTLAVLGGDGGSTRLSVLGFAASDKVTPAVTVTDTVNGTVTGVGRTIRFNSLSFLDYDGRGGRNNFAYRDGTNASFGSIANPGAGIVYQPKGVASGEVRLAGVGPVVNFVNINGDDADGFLIDGDANRTGALDTLTVVGVSDAALGVAGLLAGSVAASGADTFDITDHLVVVSNESLGQLRTLAVVPSTVRTLIVQGGNESGAGDKFNVTPSSTLDILVDGQGPTRKRDGNSLKLNTAEATRLERSSNPFFGTTQTRVVTESGASVAFQNFPNAAGVRSIFAVGADAGGGPRVRVYDAVTKAVLFDRFVYDPNFTGGVRVATGDVTGDGVPDLIVAAGIGGGPHIQVFDGVTFQPVASFFAYESTFTGGTFVAVGDLNGDGVGDIVVGSGNGGGPVVKVFDGLGRALSAFFAYDKGFRGGVRVASGDVNGDGKDDIVTGAGPGGGPHVRVFNATDLRVLTQFMAFDPSYAGGVYVTAGDVNGDGTADVIAGPGSDSLSVISVRDSRSGNVSPLNIFDTGVVANPDPQPSGDSAALSGGGQSSELGGLRVGVADLNASGTKQIVVSRGPGNVSRVRTYTLNPLAEAGNFLAFEPDFTGGVYVG